MLKICANCSIEKNAQFFVAKQRGKEYLSSLCKECRREKARAYSRAHHHADPDRARKKRKRQRQKNLEKELAYGREYRRKIADGPPSVAEFKKCAKCETVKPSSDFYRKKDQKDGLRSRCKACDRSDVLNRTAEQREASRRHQKASYLRHAEKRRKENSEWLESNKDRRSSYRKRYIADNKKQLLKYARERYAKDKKRFNEAAREWRRKNPEAVLELSHRRRARLAGAGGQYTKKDIERIWKAQRGKCACCRTKLGEDVHRDHIVPISKGGTNEARNVQLLCGSCNRRKHAKDPIDFMQEMGFLI
jgi:5-methylcytosine-specific restriction endonuclease McrA